MREKENEKGKRGRYKWRGVRRKKSGNNRENEEEVKTEKRMGERKKE